MRPSIGIIILFLLGGTFSSTPCKEGASGDFPTPGLECFRQEENSRRPLEGVQTCQKYLVCDPLTCRWTESKCEDGSAFNQRSGDCKPLYQADCGGGLFGPFATVVISNCKSQKVLDDCQACLRPYNPFPTGSPVVGNSEDVGDRGWNQVLISSKLDKSGYYSFAFYRRTHNGNFKVLTEKPTLIEGATIFSELYTRNRRPDVDGNIDWQIVPTVDPARFQILNPYSGEALAMTSDKLNVHFEKEVKNLVMKDSDQNDPTQLWTFTFMDRRKYPNLASNLTMATPILS